jgi:hypothetical protein
MTAHSFRRLLPIAIVAVMTWLPHDVAGQSSGQSSKTPSTGTPEHFTALAINFDAPAGGGSTMVDIDVNRWSTDAERDRLLATLLESGPDALLKALRDAPKIGAIRTPDSLGYDLRFARREGAPDGGERIVIITDRPIGFWEANNRPRSIDYPFTVIELHMNANGKGEGKLSIGTKIQADKDTGTIVLENYSTQPVLLSAVQRVR